MRRSICIAEPQTTPAGFVGNWRFTYTTSHALPKGARLKFDLGSKGREIDWEAPTTNLKKGDNTIYLELEDGDILQAKAIELPDALVPQYEFVLPKALSVGRSFTIVIGASQKKGYRKPGSNSNATQTPVLPLY
jgi:hypothetical protein